MIDRAYYNRFVNGRTSGHEDGNPMSRRQLCSCLMSLREVFLEYDCFFCPYVRQGLFPFGCFFREMGRLCSCSGGCVGNVGLVGIFFPFSSDLIGNLFHCLGGLFCFFRRVGGIGIGSLRSGDFGLN